jgi:ATP-dependent Clp protease ATP-binding subunit ClpC
LPPPAGPASIEPAPTELGARLFPLRQSIESFGDSSAHPREIAAHDAFKQAVALLADASVPADVVLEYALGANWAMSCAAMAALASRHDREDALGRIVSHWDRVGPWSLHFALALIESAPVRPPLGALMLRLPEHAASHGLVPAMYDAHFRRREALGDTATFGNMLSPAVEVPGTAEELLNKIEHPFAGRLRDELRIWRARRIDTGFLKDIGRLWGAEEDPLLVEHPAIASAVQTIETAVLHSPPRSVLIVAEARAGKSAVAHLAGARLAREGYTVFEASGFEIMSGQKYFGELEARIRRLAIELSAEKRVIWYVPDLLQIMLSGTHQGQSAAILDQVTPDLSAGRMVIISECTPGGLTRSLQHRPALRNVFDIVRLPTVTPAQAEAVVAGFLERVARHAKLRIEPGLGAVISQIARHYLGDLQTPGAELDLIKLSSNRAVANGEDAITRDGVLQTLAQLTGLPRAVLDESEKMELAQIRAFFSARVIGQAEAVDAVVDRIAMFKAGLTDPGRPIGVFLFAGPTGTGKTELAKTLAEYLFGTAERLIRLDMSEFQTHGSTEKIIGAGQDAEAQSLIQRVRKQPFAVILLDEFEKAHASVWDLFLQVFDDGRLSDSSGQTADFRHTIIILTSNLGATAHRSAGLGFAPQSDTFSQAQVQRAVAQSFRPEFVNRLDKVIVFQPLTRERMRSILRKELTRVLERRGLRNREWAVEWESSALEFLLEKGFTVDMGARPLKRAIDQHLLAPLAATMVERRFPVGDQFLFVRSDGNSIQVEFVDPNGAETAAAPAGPAIPAAASADQIAAVILQPAGTREERDMLARDLIRLESELDGPEWNALRDSLAQQMADRTFWNRDDRQRQLARYALMDRVKAAQATARALDERHARGLAGRPGQFSRDLASRLALQLLLVEHGRSDALMDAPIEVVLQVEPAMESEGDAMESRQWCDRVLYMYRGWATLRRMQLTVRQMTAGTVYILTGFGAHSILAREVGLHVLEPGESRRCVARVRVAPLRDSRSAAEIPMAAIADALATAPLRSGIVRRYRTEPSPLVRDAERGWRTGRLDDVLAGNFDLFS